MKRLGMSAIGVFAIASQLAFGQIHSVERNHSEMLTDAATGAVVEAFWVPAGLALKACMKNATCRRIAKKSTKAAIKWAMDHLIDEIF